jgi:Protein tyrosine and serine/threonine kinase/Ankyrin repeats (3 copies)
MGNQGSKSINLSDKEDNEDLDFAVKLLKTGSNPNELNSSGKSYLRIALEKGNWQLFKFFYEIGCKIIPVLDNETPLHYAVRNSHNDLVRFFLRNSSLFPNYKNSKDSEGRTSLHIAAMQGNPELVALLLKYNSDKDVKDKYGKTCKDLAIDNNCSDLEEILELLGSEEVIVCSPCTIKDIKSPHKRRVSSRSTYYSSVADTESKFDYLESVLRDSRIPVIPSQELKLGEVISRGSSCVVYKGIWRGTEVAIKQFKLEYSTSPKETNKFIKEMQVLSQTRHPNLILLMGVCIDQPNLCIISELVLNNSLFQALHKSHRSMSLETRFKISIQIAQGLVYLHQNLPPIIHRDLKPENCLVRSM